MNRCFLSLGSNQKYPERQIRQAIQSLRSIPQSTLIKSSSLFWSTAWGVEVQQDFCNGVIKIDTRLTPIALLSACQKIERRQGRVRKKYWGPRVIDIDIILYGNRTIKTPKLTIPHPYYTKRDFVLIPLMEVRNDSILLSTTMSQ